MFCGCWCVFGEGGAGGVCAGGWVYVWWMVICFGIGIFGPVSAAAAALCCPVGFGCWLRLFVARSILGGYSSTCDQIPRSSHIPNNGGICGLQCIAASNEKLVGCNQCICYVSINSRIID